MQSNLFFEMFPLIGFFAVYYFTKNIFAATLVCIVASWAQVLLNKVVYGKIAKNTLISTLLITIFGGLTLIFHNKTFVMLKPTVLYWVFACSLFIATKLGKNPIKLLLQDQIQVTDRIWANLNHLWVFFFLGMGILNLFIAFHFSEYMWVKFKVFGGIILMLLFTIISGLYIYTSKGRIDG